MTHKKLFIIYRNIFLIEFQIEFYIENVFRVFRFGLHDNHVIKQTVIIALDPPKLKHSFNNNSYFEFWLNLKGNGYKVSSEKAKPLLIRYHIFVAIYFASQNSRLTLQLKTNIAIVSTQNLIFDSSCHK